MLCSFKTRLKSTLNNSYLNKNPENKKYEKIMWFKLKHENILLCKIIMNKSI